MLDASVRRRHIPVCLISMLYRCKKWCFYYKTNNCYTYLKLKVCRKACFSTVKFHCFIVYFYAIGQYQRIYIYVFED